MKKSFMLLALLMQSFFVFSQHRISGKVTDGSSGDVIPGVNVFIPEMNKGTITDSEGKYSLEVNFTRPQTVEFSFVGYAKEVFTVKESRSLDVSLTPSIRLEEIIIRSVRADETTPVTQNTISKKEIRQVFNGEDPQFFLERLTPSITVESESGTYNNNYGKMRLRGIDQKRINITLNGIPLNDMIDHGVYFSNFADFGNSIESVQIQRGVGTTTNGTSSYAGSINFESASLQDRDAGTEIQLGAGSYNSYRTSIEYATGMLDNNSAFYGRFSRIWSDGYRDNTGTNAYSFFLSGGWFLEKDLIKLNAFTGRTKTGLGYEMAPLEMIKENPRVNILDENDVEDFGQSFVQLQHSRSFSQKFSLVSSAYYGNAGGDFPWGYRDNGTLYQINYPLTNHHYGLMTNAHITSSTKLSFDAGIHAYTFRRQNMEQLVPDYANPYYHERSRKNEIAAFAKGELKVNNLLIYGDVQVRTQELIISPDYEYMDTTNYGDISHNWTFINPKVGLSYIINRNTNAYVSYGRSGREPTKRDIIGGFTLSKQRLGRTMDKSIVKPEFVNDFEAGLRFNKGILKGQANLFYMDFRNELSPTGALIAFGSSLRQNVERSYRRGIESDFTIDLDKLYFSGIVTYMEAEIEKIELSEQTSGKLKSALTPQWNMNMTLGYKPLKGLDIQLHGRYLDEYYTDLMNTPEYVVPSYFIMNSRLVYQIENFTFNFELNNLFDKLYYSFGAPVDPDYDGVYEPGYLPSAGRNFYFTLTTQF